MRRIELEAKTKQELLDLSRKLDVAGRSSLSKDGLIEAVMKAQARKRRSPFTRRKKVAKVSRAARTTTRAPAKKTPTRVAKKTAAKQTTAAAKKPVRATKRRTPAPVHVTSPAATTARRPTARTHPASPKRRPAEVKERPAETKRRSARGAPRPAETPRGPVGAPPEMPERYGKDCVVLLVRDPHWLHAYWEVTDKSLGKLQRKLGDEWEGHRRILRVYTYPQGLTPDQVDGKGSPHSSDIDVPPETANWYIHVGGPDRTYQVAVGILTRSGKFYAIARSNVVMTPRDDVSPVTDEEWTSPPETLHRLYDMTGGGGSPAGGSAELGMLLRERMRSDWSSGMLASMASGAPPRPQPKERGFWFILDAELIIYGATEPDASVTVQGRAVKLRSDGSFSLRFQLPDGTQVIDAVAVSADKAFSKSITPTVRRETRATEMIESGTGS
jgi:hypothetical protein